MNFVQHKTTHNFFTCAVLVLVFVKANSTCVENLCKTGTKLFKNLCQRFVFSWKICIFGVKLLFLHIFNLKISNHKIPKAGLGIRQLLWVGTDLIWFRSESDVFWKNGVFWSDLMALKINRPIWSDLIVFLKNR